MSIWEKRNYCRLLYSLTKNFCPERPWLELPAIDADWLLCARAMGRTWWCQCCGKHRSAHPRQCSCCGAWVAPGCSPELCLILDEQHGAPYNLCKKCATVALTMSADNQHDDHRKKRRRVYLFGEPHGWLSPMTFIKIAASWVTKKMRTKRKPRLEGLPQQCSGRTQKWKVRHS